MEDRLNEKSISLAAHILSLAIATTISTYKLLVVRNQQREFVHENVHELESVQLTGTSIFITVNAMA